MANYDLPSDEVLRWASLQAVRDLGGSATISEITEMVAKALDLTQEQQAIPHGQGRTKLEYRLAWSRTRLKLIGLLTNAGSRSGVWAVTDKGYAAASSPEIESLYQTYLASKSLAHVDAAGESVAGLGDAVDTDETWRDQLLTLLKGITPSAFERLAQRLMREAGFLNVSVLGTTGDGGIDGVGTFRNGLVSWTVYFQCKRYKGSVGAGEVRDFRGAMSGRGEKGLLITTGTFTSAAKDEANRDGAPSVDLVDGIRLCDLLRELNLGVVSIPRTEYDISIEGHFFEAI